MVQRDKVSNAVVCSSELHRQFTYQPPTGDQSQRYQEINAACRDAAATIEQLCPDGPMRDAAIMSLITARMQANASIATHSRPPSIVSVGHSA